MEKELEKKEKLNVEKLYLHRCRLQDHEEKNDGKRVKRVVVIRKP